jgi:hypothetical protein
VKQWTQFAATDRSYCQELTTNGADPTYTEFLTCLELQRDARELQEEEERDKGTTAVSPKPRPAPEIP